MIPQGSKLQLVVKGMYYIFIAFIIYCLIFCCIISGKNGKDEVHDVFEYKNSGGVGMAMYNTDEVLQTVFITIYCRASVVSLILASNML